MFFRQLATKEASLSYLFGCGSKGKAIAVDVVAGDEDWFIEEAAKQDVSITHVIDTHVHAGWHFDRDTDRLHSSSSTDSPPCTPKRGSSRPPRRSRPR